MPFSIPPLASAALAAVLTALLLRWLIPVLQRSLLDRPNSRSSHQVPTPRGGGVAIVVVGSLLTAAFGEGRSAWVPLLCTPLALVGFLDDRFDLPAPLRFAIQLLTGAALLAYAALPLPLWSWPVVLISVAAVINFVNFMDGLDGLVALSGALLMASAGLWSVAGALLGFLIWNWSPARVFMGDVGSTWLGAVLAGMVLQQVDRPAALGLLLVGFPLLADALICVLRRWRAGQAIFQAHRLHLFQRLQQAGWSHAAVALLYGGATLTLALAHAFVALQTMLLLVCGELLVAAVLDQRVAKPFQP